MTTPFTRRAALSAGLSATLLPWASASHADLLAQACRLMPEQDLGPYHLADGLLRGDIRDGMPGVPLELRLLVLDAETCRPLTGAAVDLWHCDAAGAYSGFGGDSHRFLRGIQLTDRDGIAQFQTIFPGCYPGRTNHIHFQVRTAGARDGDTYRGGHVVHTGQVFFPEAITAELMRRDPYTAQRARRMAQSEDAIFRHQNGTAAIARLTPVAVDNPDRGFEAQLVAALADGNG